MTYFYSTTGEAYELLLPIAIILVLSKVFALLCHRIKLPEVIGFLLSGVVLGLIYFIPNQEILTDYTTSGLNNLAKIGVILIMFSAGLETDLSKVKAVGYKSILITILGVIVPIGLGSMVAFIFFKDNGVYSNLFYGVILSATSVSITVQVLKEMHKLDSELGSALVSSAIIDDVIGIILLSLIISLNGGDINKYSSDVSLNILFTILMMVGFFALCIIAGFLVKKLFNWMGNKWPHHVRIPIFGFALCFLLSYLAEKVFDVADITGAYIAGLILSSTNNKEYIDRRANITSNLIFAPLFFASISMKIFTANIDFTNIRFLFFGLLWVFMGIIGKVIGAGLGAKISKMNIKDSLAIGVGMMARAEVLIVCAQKGINAGLIDIAITPYAIILIIITSFVTPIILKLIYKKENLMNESML